MIDVDVLRAAGLTNDQIVAVFEAAAPLVAELRAYREREVVIREQNRKRQQKQRARHGDCHGDIKKANGINGHVTVTSLDSSSLFFLESEEKKESAKCHRDGFEQFYAAYPKKVGKIEAEKAYAKALKRATPAEIMAGLEKQKPSFPTERKFIPHPATWLNAGRWLDEAEPSRWLNGIEGVM